MARLLPGENDKIDRINNLVYLVQNGNDYESNESLTALLDLFKPLMLKICKKWSDYFDDKCHAMKSFDDLMSDCKYWFYNYTKNVYIIDGKATYNKFIHDHINQRVRYIYEREIKYHKGLLFPDPDRRSDGETDMFDDVISNYGKGNLVGMVTNESMMIESDMDDAKHKLYGKVIELVGCGILNDREREIFTEVVINQKTHEQMGERFGISRTRVTQILAKARLKLYKKIEDDAEVWQLLDDANIDISNPKIM